MGRATQSEKRNASRPISRVLCRLRGDDHSSGPCVAAWFLRPTRMRAHGRAEACASLHPYSVLLPAGLAVPASLRSRRWALTPPFHHRLRSGPRPNGFDQSAFGRLFSVALSLRSLSADVIRRRIRVEPGLSSSAPFPALRSRPPGRLAWANVVSNRLTRHRCE